jgi:hypothetical protein
MIAVFLFLIFNVTLILMTKIILANKKEGNKNEESN